MYLYLVEFSLVMAFIAALSKSTIYLFIYLLFKNITVKIK